MDFSKLDWVELGDFLYKHGIQIVSDQRIAQAEQLWNQLVENDQNTLENSTVPVVDLYLAHQVKEIYGQESPYLLSQVLSMSNEDLIQFQDLFSIPFSESNYTQSDLEFLRDRIVRILKFSDLLIDDTFLPADDTPSNPDPDRHAQVWSGLLLPDDLANPEDFGEYILMYYPDIVEEMYERDADLDELYSEEDIEQLKGQLNRRIVEYIQTQAEQEGKILKRGDIVERGEDQRNEGRFIYDGAQIISLDYEPDDYGNLPRQFHFPEFPINYWYVPYLDGEDWVYSIEHNEYQWINLDRFKDELDQNLRGPIFKPEKMDTGVEPIGQTLKGKERKGGEGKKRKERKEEKSMFYRTHIKYQGQIYNFEVPAADEWIIQYYPNVKIGQPNYYNGAFEYNDETGYYCFGG